MPNRGQRDGKGLVGLTLHGEEMARIGTAVKRLENWCSNAEEDGLFVKQVKLINKSSDTGEWLCIITADTENGPKVAFHGGSGLAEALRGLFNRLQNSSIVWKEDSYATSNDSG